jgi:hypothetical protein
MVQWSVSQVMVGTTRVRFPQVADLISVKVRVRDRLIGQKIALKSAVVTCVTSADLRQENWHVNQSKNHLFQCIAIWCNLLQFIAIYCNVLQFFAIYWRFIAIWFNFLHFYAICCNLLKLFTSYRNLLQCIANNCNLAEFSAIYLNL